ncbi:lantibiotic dehydratase [Micromonospora sp. NBC_00362]|uniref:lantibiotic dehydratase n=1 Tax=Micromonospora sp. NBC_00362 TaxID=2975975 RepID=UPI00224DA46D|nr:lantibiotic dehydratase [Micromonospora sp. NBC_00362]MCX5122046.1 lantibiotic dehydratase [Micromonospora sp. NBC_00362]
MFQATGAALIRAASYPSDLTLPTWPDLAIEQPEQWREWLQQAWALPGFAAAVTHAAPQLTDQIARVLADESVTGPRLRRVVEATLRYLLRWTTRATPFGRFAGVAPVQLGPRAAVRWGAAHWETRCPDGRFIAEHTAKVERNLHVLRSVRVVTNPIGYPRGGTWVVPCGHSDGDRVSDVEIDLTDPIRLAVQLASSPIAFADLTARMIERTQTNLPDGAERLLAALVAAGVLVSEIRPPVTVTDPVAHLSQHIDLPDPGERVQVDLRVDCAVTLPPAVVREACEAAAALVSVAPRLPGWAAYHSAFMERWGPGAAVPLRDVISVLGFPAGHRGSLRRGPTELTKRDVLLAELAQRAAMQNCAEVMLDAKLVDQLRGDDDRPPVPHTELQFTLAAATLRNLDHGDFTLTVVSGARHAGTAAGRFLHLLTPSELARFSDVYTNLPTAVPGADAVQISGPPLGSRLAALARAPELLPVLPVGDFHPEPQWTLADLAVAGDGQRLWLVSRTTSRPVEPMLLNCLLLPTLQQPLIRFLTEIPIAWTAPCVPFDWGRCHSLPFLPRVRRGRSILHLARWTITAAALPEHGAPWHQWRAAWQRHREQHRLPDDVLLGSGDARLRLDLDDTAHLALLRSHLDRHRHATLIEAPGRAGWIDGRPAELLLTLTRTPPHDELPPRPARPASTAQHRPGQSLWLDARLTGRTEHILADLSKRPEVLPAGWWFLRYPDPEPHLRLRIPLGDADQFANVARDVAAWAERLDEQGLLADYSLATYRPETRHGSGPTLAAAEAVFAADSRAVLADLTGDRHAMTAASMITIAEGFTGDGARWITEYIPRRSGPRLDHTQLNQARRPHRDDELAAALTTALTAYRALVDRDGLDPDQVLADLLHLHHARMIGVDLASERHCLRIARAAAHTALIRGAS